MIEFQPLPKRQADELFTALPKEAKWSEVVGTLLAGQPVFVPHMTRNQLETVRRIVNSRQYGLLRSKSTDYDGVPGKVLRMIRRGG